jgi:hypothetical protein
MRSFFETYLVTPLLWADIGLAGGVGAAARPSAFFVHRGGAEHAASFLRIGNGGLEGVRFCPPDS